MRMPPLVALGLGRYASPSSQRAAGAAEGSGPLGNFGTSSMEPSRSRTDGSRHYIRATVSMGPSYGYGVGTRPRGDPSREAFIFDGDLGSEAYFSDLLLEFGDTIKQNTGAIAAAHLCGSGLAERTTDPTVSVTSSSSQPRRGIK